LSLFIIPSGKGEALLKWSDTRNAPWDVLLLYGGGLALADAITRTGLAKWIGVQLSAIEAAPLIVIVLAIVLLVLVVTEFASNVATAAGFMPVLAGVASATGVDGMLLGMTAAMTASWGFMMPAGTAPNAIAFGTGHVRVRDMIRSGFAADLLGVALIPLAVWFGLYLLRL
jgi:sodium-dependent dicarboxylate transporter 2/3/5